MNERINQLADQVGLGVTHNGIVLTKNVNAAEAFEKFAQLIVLECAAYLNGAMEVYTQSEQDLYDRGATKIKQHFGVE
jgi:hypothetical protein